MVLAASDPDKDTSAYRARLPCPELQTPLLTVDSPCAHVCSLLCFHLRSPGEPPVPRESVRPTPSSRLSCPETPPLGSCARPTRTVYHEVTTHYLTMKPNVEICKSPVPNKIPHLSLGRGFWVGLLGPHNGQCCPGKGKVPRRCSPPNRQGERRERRRV